MRKQNNRPNARLDVTAVKYWEHPDFREGLSWQERAELEADMITKEQEVFKRYDAIASVYKTADSILTGKSVDVKAGDFSANTNSKAVAYNDGSTIYLNRQALNELTNEAITSLNGVNYHEVAHLLWTPRQGTDLVKQLVSEGLIMAMNMLEDMRIESLLVTRFPATRASLTASTLSYLISRDNGRPQDVYASISSRSYLPLDIRQAYADLFVKSYGSGTAKALKAITDEYVRLSLPNKADSNRALELVRAYAELLGLPRQDAPDGGGGQAQDADGNSPKPTSSCSDRDPMKSGRYEKGKDQSDVIDRMSDSESENLDGDNSADSPKGKSNKDNENGSPSNGVGGKGQSEYVPSDGTNNLGSDVAELIQSALDELMRSTQIKKEANEIRRSVQASDANQTKVGKTSYVYADVPVEDLAIARDFSNELVQLQIDNDPAWNRRTPAGKLNIQRTMNMDINDINNLFDRWDNGNEAFDIEAVILMDNSGSMGSSMTEACRATWTIKKALESIEARVTAFIFDDQTKMLYEANEEAQPRKFRAVGAGGSTNPYVGLLEAERILMSSRKTTKLLFIVTDGAWDNEARSEETVKRINSIDGAITNLVFIANNLYGFGKLDTKARMNLVEQSRHKCQNISLVSRPRDIVNVARGVVKALARNSH